MALFKVRERSHIASGYKEEEFGPKEWILMWSIIFLILYNK